MAIHHDITCLVILNMLRLGQTRVENNQMQDQQQKPRLKIQKTTKLKILVKHAAYRTSS